MNRPELLRENEKFKKVFGFDMPVFMMGLHVLMFDLGKFDNKLHEIHGEYNPDGDTSIQDFVIAKYGNDAYEYLESLMQEI